MNKMLEIKKIINDIKQDSIPLQNFVRLRWHFIIYITAIAVIYQAYDAKPFPSTEKARNTHLYELQSLDKQWLEQAESFSSLKRVWKNLNEDPAFMKYKPGLDSLNSTRDDFIKNCKLKGDIRGSDVSYIDFFNYSILSYLDIFKILQKVAITLVLCLILLEIYLYLTNDCKLYFFISNLLLCLLIIVMLWYLKVSIEWVIISKDHLGTVIRENALLLEKVKSNVAVQELQYQRFLEWSKWRQDWCWRLCKVAIGQKWEPCLKNCNNFSFWDKYLSPALTPVKRR